MRLHRAAVFVLIGLLAWALPLATAEAKRNNGGADQPDADQPDADQPDEPAETHYGKSRWGMSQEQFLEVYPACVELGPGQWALGMRVGGHDAVRTFRFVADQLVNVNVMFADTHTDPQGFVDDYRDIHAKLVERYGDPVEDSTRWSDEMFRDTPEQWGAALLNDHVRFMAQWTAPGMNVRQFLEVEGISILHGIIYVSTRLWDLHEAESGSAAPSISP